MGKMGKIKKRTFKNERKEFQNDSFIQKETKPRLTKPIVQQEIKQLRKLNSIACKGIIKAKEQPITELIEISDDSCELKATRQVLKQVNRAKIEASTSCTKSPCRMSNTSIGDQDSQSKKQLDFFESVQERLHKHVHATIQASNQSEIIYKPFNDTRELIENRLRRKMNEEYSE